MWTLGILQLMTSRFLNLIFVVCLVLASASLVLAQVQATAQPIIIIETAYNMDAGYSRGKLWWVVVIKNPNETFFARRPEIRITAKSRDGHIMAVKDKNFPEIPPGGELAYGDDLDPGEKPDAVTFEVTGAGFERTQTRPADYSKRFEFRQPLLRCNSFNCRLTAEVFNPYDRDADLMGTILFRSGNGKLLGGDTFFIKQVPARSTRAFDTSLWIKQPEGTVKTELSAFCGLIAHWDDLIK
jgi:hypothetical protein